MLPFSKHSFKDFNTKALMKLAQKQIVQFANDVAYLAVAEWERNNDYDFQRTAVFAVILSERTKEAYQSLSVENTIHHCLETISCVSRIASKKTITGLTHHTLALLYQQAKPKKVEIPITPTLQSIAEHIKTTNNFKEYSVLLDNLEEVHNITLPRELPLGLSHYVLFSLLN